MKKEYKERLFDRTDLDVGFKSIFAKLKSEYEDAYESIDTEEKEEIAKIEEIFSQKRKNVEKREIKITNELKSYLKTVEEYSTFKIEKNDNDIMDILVDIVSLYKGEQYECMFIKNKGRIDEDLIMYPVRMDIIDGMTIEDYLIEDGIILSFIDDMFVRENKINFYELNVNGTNHSDLIINDLETMELRVSKNSKRHSFILEFINFVVKYRIEKKSNDINFVELKRLEQAFIYSKKEEIDALNRKRSQEEREELERKIEKRDALLDNYIDNNFDIIDELPSEVALGNIYSSKVLRKLIESYEETSCE